MFVPQTVDWCNWDPDNGTLGPLESNREALAVAKDARPGPGETAGFGFLYGETHLMVPFFKKKLILGIFWILQKR